MFRSSDNGVCSLYTTFQLFEISSDDDGELCSGPEEMWMRAKGATVDWCAISTDSVEEFALDLLRKVGERREMNIADFVESDVMEI